MANSITAGNKITAHLDSGAKNVVVGDNNIQYICENVSHSPDDETKLQAAQKKLDAMPLETIPPIAVLPAYSRMAFGRNSLFVGREVDLRRLAKLLKGDSATSIGQMQTPMLTGLGGIGKTQLAVEFVHRYGQYFEGGVFWLNFADVNAISAQIASCGSAAMLKCADYEQKKLDEQVKLVLANWESPLPRLLVFDNCEEPELLVEWRPKTGGCRVLVTSRRAQWKAELGVEILPLEALKRAESCELLHKFRRELATDDRDLDAIANEVGDLPLALRLAGSYLEDHPNAVPPAKYLKQLRNDGLLRHRSLEHNVKRTFALSYDRLNSNDFTDKLALELLARAAYFAPGEPIPWSLLVKTVDLRVKEPDIMVENALRRLLALGLLTTGNSETLLLHRLLAHFVRGRGLISRHVLFRILFKIQNYFDVSQTSNDDIPVEVEKALSRIVPYVDTPIHLLHFIENIDAVLTKESQRLSLRQVELILHRSAIWGRLEPFDEKATTIAETDCKMAFSVLEKLHKASTKQPEYWHLSAQAHLQLGNLAQSKAKISPELAQIFLNEAIISYEKAKGSICKYGKKSLIYVSICKELGYTNALQNGWDKAEDNFCEALQVLTELKPSMDNEEYIQRFARVQEASSNMCYEKGRSVARSDKVQAISEYDKASHQTRASIDALNKLHRQTEDLAIAHWNLGDYLLERSRLSGSALDKAQACEAWRTAQTIAHALNLDYITKAVEEQLAKIVDLTSVVGQDEGVLA